MQNWEDQNFLIELVLTWYQFIQLDDDVCCNSDAMSVLSIRDIKCFVVAFYLRCQKWEIHLIYYHQMRCSLSIINKELQFLKLIKDECKWFELYSKIELRARIFDKKDEFNSAFINSFNQMFKICSFAKIENFDEENEKRREIANNSDFVFITNSLTNSLE